VRGIATRDAAIPGNAPAIDHDFRVVRDIEVHGAGNHELPVRIGQDARAVELYIRCTGVPLPVTFVASGASAGENAVACNATAVPRKSLEECLIGS
jgi:hypothetical protein